MANKVTTTTSGLPRWFWIASGAGLVWNLLGVLAYLNQVSMDTSALEPQQRDFYESFPVWATGAFAVAVFGGVLGCIALLLRKSAATSLFYASLAGVIVQVFYSLALAGGFRIFGPAGVVLPLITIGIGIALILMSRKSEQAGWLN